MLKLLFFCLVLSLCRIKGNAASFNCAKATTPQEKAVCADKDLSKLDEDLAAAYSALRGQLSANGAAEVQQDQRQWLAWLPKVCTPNAAWREMPICLKNEYTSQVELLKTGWHRVDGMLFFPRVKVLVSEADAKERPGVGRFTWPEIDQPTPEQSAWNQAIHAKVVDMSFEEAKPSHHDFEISSVDESEVYIFYTMKAANGRFIAVDLINSTYGFGAAHPNEYSESFEWWLSLKRELKAEDVFRAGSGWEEFLGQACYKKLTSGEYAKSLLQDKEVVGGATDAAKQVSDWTLDAHHLEVDYPEYSVAPRAAGSVSAKVSWQELKPYLAAGFDPATLPEPIKR